MSSARKRDECNKSKYIDENRVLTFPFDNFRPFVR